eukprot:COSAG02_NODE_1193_length_13958_cov_4.939029_8_plen_147_part_00
MHTMDSLALAKLATAIGRSTEAALLAHRAATMAALIEENLWDDSAGIYVNKMPDGRWNRRVAPTSFYALQTNSSTDARVGRMMTEWFFSKQHFCISRSGDFSGNDDACYYGLPSIERSDPAFPKLGYWRGYVWGPMAQLTYLLRPL